MISTSEHNLKRAALLKLSDNDMIGKYQLHSLLNKLDHIEQQVANLNKVCHKTKCSKAKLKQGAKEFRKNMDDDELRMPEKKSTEEVKKIEDLITKSIRVGKSPEINYLHRNTLIPLSADSDTADSALDTRFSKKKKEYCIELDTEKYFKKHTSVPPINVNSREGKIGVGSSYHKHSCKRRTRHKNTFNYANLNEKILNLESECSRPRSYGTNKLKNEKTRSSDREVFHFKPLNDRVRETTLKSQPSTKIRIHKIQPNSHHLQPISPNNTSYDGSSFRPFQSSSIIRTNLPKPSRERRHKKRYGKSASSASLNTLNRLKTMKKRVKFNECLLQTCVSSSSFLNDKKKRHCEGCLCPSRKGRQSKVSSGLLKMIPDERSLKKSTSDSSGSLTTSLGTKKQRIHEKSKANKDVFVMNSSSDVGGWVNPKYKRLYAQHLLNSNAKKNRKKPDTKTALKEKKDDVRYDTAGRSRNESKTKANDKAGSSNSESNTQVNSKQNPPEEEQTTSKQILHYKPFTLNLNFPRKSKQFSENGVLNYSSMKVIERNCHELNNITSLKQGMAKNAIRESLHGKKPVNEGTEKKKSPFSEITAALFNASSFYSMDSRFKKPLLSPTRSPLPPLNKYCLKNSRFYHEKNTDYIIKNRISVKDSDSKVSGNPPKTDIPDGEKANHVKKIEEINEKLDALKGVEGKKGNGQTDQSESEKNSGKTDKKPSLQSWTATATNVSSALKKRILQQQNKIDEMQTAMIECMGLLKALKKIT